MTRRVVPVTLMQTLNRLLPSPWLKLSALAQLAALLALALAPSHWPAWLLVFIVSHRALVWGGLMPRSRLLGPNWTRLPGSAGAVVALTIDDGPDPAVTP